MPAIDLQEVLRNLKAAQQKPLGTLEKSTFTQSMSATSGLTFYALHRRHPVYDTPTPVPPFTVAAP